MRFAIAALVFTAAAAQNNFVGQSGSKWFQGAGSWSLSRVPRFPDDVAVNGKSVTFVHAEEPGYYAGSTQADDIEIIGTGELEIVGTSEFELGKPQNMPQDCVVGAWGAFGSCSASNEPGRKTRTRTITQPRFGGAACTTAVVKHSVSCNEFNTFQLANGLWYNSPTEWSYGHIPHHDDKVLVKATSTCKGNRRSEEGKRAEKRVGRSHRDEEPEQCV